MHLHDLFKALTIMRNYCLAIVALLSLCFASSLASADESKYCAVKYLSERSTLDTWSIHSRAGGIQDAGPHLSSFGAGEQATGRMTGPVFRLTADKVTFLTCGHDGQGGGAKLNWIGLCDAGSGELLRQSFAPGHDDFREYSWDTSDIRGRDVQFVVEDMHTGSAYAWMGVQKVDAGPECRVDFSKEGLPKGWKSVAPPADPNIATRAIDNGPVPFKFFDCGSVYSLVPENAGMSVACGPKLDMLYLLGCTTTSNQLLLPGATVDILYADGSADHIPLSYGFTLAYMQKKPGQNDGTALWPVGNGTECILAIRPQAKPIKRIGLTKEKGARPRVLAMTCELADGESPPGGMVPLQSTPFSPEYKEWLAAHTVSSTDWKSQMDEAEVYRLHGVPYTAAQWQAIESTAPVRFRKMKIADTAYEAASVADVDHDGDPDIISGGFWYEGPTFKTSHKYADVGFDGNYHDDFADIPLDCNGDGYVDIVSGGWTGGTQRWFENPKGKATGELWTVHEIDKPGPIETTRIWDVDGDGIGEISPNAGPDITFYRLDLDRSKKGKGTFTKYVVAEGKGAHGLGFGDVNGDGRGDFVNPRGWYEAPEDPFTGEWIAHEEFNLGGTSVPALVHDVNGDGLSDIIYGAGHGYGIFWLEQSKTGEETKWTVHNIDLSNSQYHDVILADLDRDGRNELISGKRYKAHCGHDPGSDDPMHLRYWAIDRRGRFTQHTIDYGSPESASGLGIYGWVEDVNGDRYPDLVAPGKEGLYLFSTIKNE